MSNIAPDDDFPIHGHGLRVAIVATRWNASIVSALVEGAELALERVGVSAGDTTVMHVPGAFELPVATAHLARSGSWDAVVCLGAVIRGDTPHFDYVAGPVAHQLSAIAVETGVPVGFGLLTCDTPEQARERAGGRVGNKGEEAALAAVETASLLRTLRS